MGKMVIICGSTFSKFLIASSTLEVTQNTQKYNVNKQ